MPRRVSLPTADDLFRPTVVPDPVEADDTADDTADATADTTTDGTSEATDSAGDAAAKGTGSGRVRHDEKMTVYITSDELLDIEHARLMLRRLSLIHI